MRRVPRLTVNDFDTLSSRLGPTATLLRRAFVAMGLLHSYIGQEASLESVSRAELHIGRRWAIRAHPSQVEKPSTYPSMTAKYPQEQVAAVWGDASQ